MLIILLAFDTQEDCECIIAVYESYYNAMLGIAFAILKDEVQAEDVVHDAIILLADHTQRIRQVDQETARHFIATVTKHAAIDQYRRNKRRETHLADEVESEWALSEAKSAFSEDDIVQMMTYEETVQHIKNLPATSREILLMHYFYELSCPEIAKLYGIKPAAARQRLKRAREQLNMKIIEENT